MAAPDAPPAPVRTGSVPWVVRVDEQRDIAHVAVAKRAVPNVKGMPVRRAAYELHRAGFRVSLDTSASGGDRAAGTAPPAGALLITGGRVVLERAP